MNKKLYLTITALFVACLFSFSTCQAQQMTVNTKQDLDAVTQGHPAFFLRVDLHIGVANSSALAAAGVSDSTPNPPGGQT